MKKLFLSAILFLTGYASLDAAYQPAAGPIPLTDRGQTFNARGPIMQELINNPTLNAQHQAIIAFDRRGPNLRPYQEIMQNLSTSTESALVLGALQAFEQIIMHLYNHKVYMYGSYDSVRSMFVTGIRASWFDPRYYAPKNWISDNDPTLKQYLDELDQIAGMMYHHDPYEYTRLKTMVHSYRHWRLNLALSCAAYLMFDIHNHGYDQSIIKQFGDRGLLNTPGIIANHASNFGHGVNYGYKGTKFVAKNYWKYVLKPVGKFVLGGWNYAFGSSPVKADDEKKKIINSANPNEAQVKQEPVAPKIEQPTPSNVVNQKNQKQEDDLAYLAASSPAQELGKIEQDIAQNLQPKIVPIDQTFIDKGDKLSGLIRRNIHQGIEDETQEHYAALKELAAECKAYVMQQEYDQARSVELLNNTTNSDETIHEIAKDHNVVYQPMQIPKQSTNDSYYVENPLLDFSQFSPKEWAVIITAGLAVGHGIGHMFP